MSMRIYLLTSLISLAAAGVSAFYDVKIALGILLSTLFSLLNMFLLSFSMKMVISSGKSDPSLMVASNIFRMALLAGVLLLAFNNPQWFSIIGVTIGLMLFMVALIIDSIDKRKKGG